jgi:hypothetical protein
MTRAQAGYVPEAQTLTALEEEGPGYRAAGRGARRPLCANAGQNACNWLVPESMESGFCLACRHNGTVPDLSVPGNLERWHELEAAKHRLFYSLLRWHLPPFIHKLVQRVRAGSADQQAT